MFALDAVGPDALEEITEPRDQSVLLYLRYRLVVVSQM